jgi:hypothetical protein
MIGHLHGAVEVHSPLVSRGCAQQWCSSGSSKVAMRTARHAQTMTCTHRCRTNCTSYRTRCLAIPKCQVCHKEKVYYYHPWPHSASSSGFAAGVTGVDAVTNTVSNIPEGEAANAAPQTFRYVHKCDLCTPGYVVSDDKQRCTPGVQPFVPPPRYDMREQGELLLQAACCKP